MSNLLLILLGTGGVLWVTLKLVAGKIIADEMRARVDDLPAVLLEFSLRRLPPELRDFYRPEWTDDLVAFNAEHERYPATKFVRSFMFAASLLINARSVRAEMKTAYKQGKQDESNERLAEEPTGGGYRVELDKHGQPVTIFELKPSTATGAISVAELLAKNGSIGAPAPGGRRRLRGYADSVTVAEFAFEVPEVRSEKTSD